MASPSAVKLVDSGSSFEIWRGPQGAMRLDWNRTQAVRIICVGHGHAEFVPPMMKRFDDAIRSSGHFMQVCEWSAMNTYDSAFRTVHAEYITAHRKQWAGAIVLQGSKIVAMGLAVANIPLGGLIKATTSRAEYETLEKKYGYTAVTPPSVK